MADLDETLAEILDSTIEESLLSTSRSPSRGLSAVVQSARTPKATLGDALSRTRSDFDVSKITASYRPPSFSSTRVPASFSPAERPSANVGPTTSEFPKGIIPGPTQPTSDPLAPPTPVSQVLSADGAAPYPGHSPAVTGWSRRSRHELRADALATSAVASRSHLPSHAEAITAPDVANSGSFANPYGARSSVGSRSAGPVVGAANRCCDADVQSALSPSIARGAAWWSALRRRNEDAELEERISRVAKVQWEDDVLHRSHPTPPNFALPSSHSAGLFQSEASLNGQLHSSRDAFCSAYDQDPITTPLPHHPTSPAHPARSLSPATEPRPYPPPAAGAAHAPSPRHSLSPYRSTVGATGLDSSLAVSPYRSTTTLSPSRGLAASRGRGSRSRSPYEDFSAADSRLAAISARSAQLVAAVETLKARLDATAPASVREKEKQREREEREKVEQERRERSRMYGRPVEEVNDVHIHYSDEAEYIHHSTAFTAANKSGAGAGVRTASAAAGGDDDVVPILGAASPGGAGAKRYVAWSAKTDDGAGMRSGEGGDVGSAAQASANTPAADGGHVGGLVAAGKYVADPDGTLRLVVGDALSQPSAPAPRPSQPPPLSLSASQTSTTGGGNEGVAGGDTGGPPSGAVGHTNAIHVPRPADAWGQGVSSPRAVVSPTVGGGAVAGGWASFGGGSGAATAGDPHSPGTFWSASPKSRLALSPRSGWGGGGTLESVEGGQTAASVTGGWGGTGDELGGRVSAHNLSPYTTRRPGARGRSCSRRGVSTPQQSQLDALQQSTRGRSSSIGPSRPPVPIAPPPHDDAWGSHPRNPLEGYGGSGSVSHTGAPLRRGESYFSVSRGGSQAAGGGGDASLGTTNSAHAHPSHTTPYAGDTAVAFEESAAAAASVPASVLVDTDVPTLRSRHAPQSSQVPPPAEAATPAGASTRPSSAVPTPNLPRTFPTVSSPVGGSDDLLALAGGVVRSPAHPSATSALRPQSPHRRVSFYDQRASDAREEAASSRLGASARSDSGATALPPSAAVPAQTPSLPPPTGHPTAGPSLGSEDADGDGGEPPVVAQAVPGRNGGSASAQGASHGGASGGGGVNTPSAMAHGAAAAPGGGGAAAHLRGVVPPTAQHGGAHPSGALSAAHHHPPPAGGDHAAHFEALLAAYPPTSLCVHLPDSVCALCCPLIDSAGRPRTYAAPPQTAAALRIAAAAAHPHYRSPAHSPVRATPPRGVVVGPNGEMYVARPRSTSRDRGTSRDRERGTHASGRTSTGPSGRSGRSTSPGRARGDGRRGQSRDDSQARGAPEQKRGLRGLFGF